MNQRKKQVRHTKRELTAIAFASDEARRDTVRHAVSVADALVHLSSTLLHAQIAGERLDAEGIAALQRTLEEGSASVASLRVQFHLVDDDEPNTSRH